MAGGILASLFYSLLMEPIAVELVDMDAYPVKLPFFPGRLSMPLPVRAFDLVSRIPTAFSYVAHQVDRPSGSLL